MPDFFWHENAGKLCCVVGAKLDSFAR